MNIRGLDGGATTVMRLVWTLLNVPATTLWAKTLTS